MRQIFIFTASKPEARKHLKDSIEEYVPIDVLNQYLDQKIATELRSILPDPDGFYAWGAVSGPQNIHRWKDMREGDIVLTVYENKYHYISTVIEKLHSPSLATKIWGTTKDGKTTWEYLYFLTKPKKVKIDVGDALLDGFLNKKYFGFTRINKIKVQAIQEKYNSLDNFFNKVFLTSIPQTAFEQQMSEAESSTDVFDPTSLVDGRKKIFKNMFQRRGQPDFRKKLLKAYDSKCAVSGCDVEEVLEAAHIMSYLGASTNHVTNGLLLRADIHTLFDIGDLKIDSNGTITVNEKLSGSIYGQFNKKKISLPVDVKSMPNKAALAYKFGE